MRLSLPEASNLAAQVDQQTAGLLIFSLLLTGLIFAIIGWFCYRYRSGSQVYRSHSEPNTLPFELSWTLALVVICLLLFGWTGRLYMAQNAPQAQAETVYVLGRQWMWKFEHASGRREISELHLPLGRPVRLLMTSQDVIHSFFVPAFRAKYDVLPGRYTEEWFTPTLKGEFQVFCSQYCGTDHADMTGKVIVMEAADYQSWLDGEGPHPSMAAQGAELFHRLGCNDCHENTVGVRAPDLDGLFGSQVDLQDGSQVEADEAYLRESIAAPGAKIVAGYHNLMPIYGGQLASDEIDQLVEYIKSRRRR